MNRNKALFENVSEFDKLWRNVFEKFQAALCKYEWLNYDFQLLFGLALVVDTFALFGTIK